MVVVWLTRSWFLVLQQAYHDPPTHSIPLIANESLNGCMLCCKGQRRDFVNRPQ